MSLDRREFLHRSGKLLWLTGAAAVAVSHRVSGNAIAPTGATEEVVLGVEFRLLEIG